MGSISATEIFCNNDPLKRSEVKREVNGECPTKKYVQELKAQKGYLQYKGYCGRK
jgi:hypothetical protein